MPLTSKGQEILANLTKEYGAEKGKEVLYAGKNSGKFTGIDDDEAMSDSDPARLRGIMLDKAEALLDSIGSRLDAVTRRK